MKEYLQVGVRMTPAAAPDIQAEQLDWQDSAACAGIDPELFFPGRYAPIQTRIAKKICAACPVRTECLNYALTHDADHGIFGGLGEQDRAKLRRYVA